MAIFALKECPIMLRIKVDRHIKIRYLLRTR